MREASAITLLTRQLHKKGAQEDNPWGCLWSPVRMMQAEAVSLIRMTQQLSTTTHVQGWCCCKRTRAPGSCDGATLNLGTLLLSVILRLELRQCPESEDRYKWFLGPEMGTETAAEGMGKVNLSSAGLKNT